jgi:hypothetical protein
LLLQVLDLLDRGHSSVGLLGELALDISAGALGAASSLCCIALDLSFTAGIAAGVFSPLPVCPLLGLSTRGARQMPVI